MSTGKSISRLLERHKALLGRHLQSSDITQHLVRKGLVTPEEEALVLSERNSVVRGEVFVNLIARKGFPAFKELCVSLEIESPHLLTQLLLDTTARSLLFDLNPSPSHPRPESVSSNSTKRESVSSGSSKRDSVSSVSTMRESVSSVSTLRSSNEQPRYEGLARSPSEYRPSRTLRSPTEPRLPEGVVLRSPSLPEGAMHRSPSQTQPGLEGVPMRSPHLPEGVVLRSPSETRHSHEGATHRSTRLIEGVVLRSPSEPHPSMEGAALRSPSEPRPQVVMRPPSEPRHPVKLTHRKSSPLPRKRRSRSSVPSGRTTSYSVYDSVTGLMYSPLLPGFPQTQLHGSPSMLQRPPSMIHGSPMLVHGSTSMMHGSPSMLHGSPSMLHGSPSQLTSGHHSMYSRHSREGSIISNVLNHQMVKYNNINRDLELNRSSSAVSMSLENSDYGYISHNHKDGYIGHKDGYIGHKDGYIPHNHKEGYIAHNFNTKLIIDDLTELLEEPVEETSPKQQGGERIAWEFHHVTLSRVPGYGFGIAVSGGRDNPHFTNGDPSIAISDVLKAGPAEGKLMINDRVISANSVSLEGVDYATAVQVLRDSGQTVNLVVKRRVVLPSPAEPQNIRVSLTKNKKKEDYGIILGCKIYVKEITGRSVAERDGNLQEGDMVYKINNTPLEGLSLKEAKKLLDAAKDKVDIVVKRDPFKASQPAVQNRTKSPSQKLEPGTEEPRNNLTANQNLYVPPPTRRDEKNNLARADQMQRDELNAAVPPRPPPPREEGLEGTASEAGTLPMSDKLPDSSADLALDFGSLRSNNTTDPSVEYGSSPRRTDDSNLSISKSHGNLPDPRFISFQKEGSVGIRLTGGNDVGIFVTAVQPGSPAAQQGLQPGDKIIKVNDMDMAYVTREEAVLYLLSLQDQIDLIAQYRKDEYDQIVQLQRGDSFYIKAHFNYDQPEKGEMSFKKSDVFHVVDTLHNGVVGSWQAFRMDPFLSGLGRAAEQVQKGVIPNKSRAEEVATQQFNAAKKEQSVSEQQKGSFFRRKRSQEKRRSKSLGKDHWEDLVWSESMSKFPAYERVSLRHPGFPRPVVIFGPVADLARERLLRDFPLKFASPQTDTTGEGTKSGIVRLSAIREIQDRGRHALLDVAPNAVDKLNYAQFYPIVILLRADNKQTIKDCRTGMPKGQPGPKMDWLPWKAHMSSKKLLEQCQKLEKLWGHSLTGTLPLHADSWYNKLTDLIEKQQTAPIWMSDAKPEESFSDDFLFPMTSRLSYASSPESDGEFCGEDTPRRSAQVRNAAARQESDNRLVRSNSDPSLARQDGTIKSEPGDIMPDFSSPPPYSLQPDQPPPEGTKRRSHGGDSKYGFPTNTRQGAQDAIQENGEDSNLSPATNGAKAQSGTFNGSGFRGQSEDRYGTVAQGTQQNTESQDPASPSKRSQSQPPGTIQNNKTSKKNGEAGSNGSIPVLPPKIDRQKKPQRKSAAERLFGRGDKGDKNAEKSTTNGEATTNTDISDNSPVDPRQGGYTSLPGGIPSTPRNTYDSNSSSNYDSYNKNSEPGYSYSRSTSQPAHSSIPPSNASTQGQGYSGPSSGKYSLPTQPPPANGQDRYRYSDYKPLPPPKSSVYKPLPPPKPKPFNRSASQPPSISESNYMNGNYLNSAPESDYPHSFHYHSSRVTGIDNGYSTTNGYPPSSPNGYTPTQPRIPNGHSGPSSHPGPPNGHTGPPNGHNGPVNGHAGHNGGHSGVPNGHVNGYDERDSNGVDSGQGSSLDRDYSSYNGQSQPQYNGQRDSRYGPPPNGPPPSGPPRSQQGQFYYNLPTPREGQVVGQNIGGGSSPRRRAPGDTLDLSNREYRGSAFELYKKPGYQPGYQPSYQDVPR